MAEHFMSGRTVRGVHPEWRIRQDVSWTSHAGRVVALQLSSSGASPLILDGSAAAIWKIISDLGSATEPMIAHAVIEQFDVSRTDVGPPLTDFLERLEEARLIALEVRFTP